MNPPEQAAAAYPARDDYTVFCEGIRALCKIDLLQYKRGQMERRIRSFAERRGTADLEAYLLELKGDPHELDAFLDRVTINVSQLWRNPVQWEVLAAHVLPELAEAGRIRAWSAGCSYGAEAYTVLAVAAETVPGVPIDMRGTDIDKRMVDRAREGCYSADDARDAPARSLERHFLPTATGWQAKPALRAAAKFEVGDLLRMRVAASAFDLILCRNTVIYFTEDVRDALHARLADALRPGGYLIIGSTERIGDPRAKGLELLYPFTYRKS
ncbi:MAG: protein-glutamate O-methyltransferase CheR [Solirubrobacteraceae bacterium]